MSRVRLRRFKPADSAAVSALFRQVYGENYVQPDVYLPSMIDQHNADNQWYSMLAVDNEHIVGHAALCRDTHCRDHAELALSLVHPAARGKGIASRLGRELLRRASRLGLKSVSIKQVTDHPYTQKMAQSLGFTSIGLLPDYVPSPFGGPYEESVVLGYQLVKGHARPLPQLEWPQAYSHFMGQLSASFGTRHDSPSKRAYPIQISQHHERVEVVLYQLDDSILLQLGQLPRHWMISIKLELSRHFPRNMHRLCAINFAFTGLMPAPGASGWYALFHRGARQRPVSFYCPHMQQLHDGLLRRPPSRLQHTQLPELLRTSPLPG
ncbi:GNAT family N-acetyltransferase [Pseudomonas sp. 6D_7.1_Bac1]|uniref:GNAT family N-acetyltransferase n=1 Tax=Pseudomonas sp. 6D_7.1_Bac1 TaxID=2971615 RepID=UPI0021C94A19|nr:GNAT family N-acetyltransferase [Pseudomonas sp. 6D_7.1_Bac1]MCU1747859.1 GNAT family N-acetyltransferase [Pseudomonas sp. 6D_7.1_Bac1]